MSRLNELRLGVMFLTRLPVGRINNAPPLASLAWTFPLVGVLPALIAWAVFGLTDDALGAALAVGALVLVTGGLHHDGLADFADGIGGGRDRAHVLEIMRDSRIGSYGVLAVGLVLILQTLAIAEVGSLPAFLFLGIGSRVAMLLALRLPPARDGGLGAMTGGAAQRAPGLVAAGIAAIWLGAGCIAALIGVTLAYLVIRALAMRRIGGQTGDVCGAVQLLAETAGWVALALTV
ncbi:Cobalamin synthase [Rhodobacteraceae bacterium THAF1]|uniref:adenosylcobinamide-GDP ribazoletransferase n=1 Tax=Palleronia sp. THAF1 TaxID=2587842 RepID=UPI000F3D82AD|nr:adenosylcobinamide-GDP ribazoletransferase [Palleronia sp. THAF1]QFU10104.1 Cobalamin synthase [Palleronia sp. THAF1]VDC16991.1 Cobalamin synthase [Rhodobacteraceae bacterium THAF1]